MAEHLTAMELRTLLANSEYIQNNAYLLLQELTRRINQNPEGAEANELVLRAASMRADFGDCSPVLDALLRKTGLFPYLDPNNLNVADQLAYEFHRPLHMDEHEIVFHRAQGEVYRALMSGSNVILSAPTSFGKSLIVDAMIASGNYENIAIIVPTIALIDETRRRLSKFVGRYKIITHLSQKLENKNIFILTQERAVDHPDIEKVDFFVIDEFYKLEPQIDSQRSLILNQILYRLAKSGAQFYLLGPNIQDIPETFQKRFKCVFFRTDYATVVSEVHRVKSSKKTHEQLLVDLCRELDEPTLIYCSSPKRVRALAELLINSGIDHANPSLDSAVDWISNNFHPDWLFAKALKKGIGIHHGRVPRALAQMAVRAFNDYQIKILICTSTLIEGVNTKAKNVVIFDNKIAQKEFDFFTFNNIKGRSGRMFQHFIGKVYLFHDPPEEELPFVDIPVFTQPEKTPGSLLIQIDREDLSPRSKKKVDQYAEQDWVDVETLKMSSGVDPEIQIRLAKHISSNFEKMLPILVWTNPDWDQLVGVCELIWEFLLEDKHRLGGVSSFRQLAMKIRKLRGRPSLKSLIEQELMNPKNIKDVNEKIDEVLDFRRVWAAFKFPKHLMTVDRIQRNVLSKRKVKPGDYSYFATAVEHWFYDPTLVALEEYGLPIQISERLEDEIRPEGNLDEVIGRLRSLNAVSLRLAPFELQVLRDVQSHL